MPRLVVLTAPLRRSLCCTALPARRAAVAVAAAPRLQVHTSRVIHTTRARLEADKTAEADSDTSESDYVKMAANFALYMAPLVLIVGIYDRYFDSPNRLRPSVLVNESFGIVSQNPHVKSRLGTELIAYGDFDERGHDVDHDGVVGSSRSVTDESISHAEVVEACRFEDQESITPTLRTRDALHLEMKYNIKGADGSRAIVYARVRDDMTKNQYEYLIVEFVETGEVLEIIDNREVLDVKLELQPPLDLQPEPAR